MIDKASDHSQAKTAKEIVIARVANDHYLRSEITFEFGIKKAASDQIIPVVCCLVRDGAYWLPAFLDHYRNQGVKEFFFLDNGSMDDTLEILKKERDVGVYSIHNSFFKDFNAHLRRVLIRIVRPRGWTLGVDIDELFDFPYSNKVSVLQLCEFLDRRRFNCMTTHMLDMFPDGPLDDLSVKAQQDPRVVHSFYSLEGLETITYDCVQTEFSGYRPDIIRLPSQDWRFFCNGVRFRKFGAKLWLTKHALFNMDGKLIPFHHPHLHLHANIANISGVLLHYKFPPNFAEQVDDALRERQYYANSSDYMHYRKTLNANETITLKDSCSKKLRSINQLLDESFLDVSEEFLTHFKI